MYPILCSFVQSVKEVEPASHATVLRASEVIPFEVQFCFGFQPQEHHGHARILKSTGGDAAACGGGQLEEGYWTVQRGIGSGIQWFQSRVEQLIKIQDNSTTQK